MKKFKLISLTALSLVSVAGISMAVVSCGDDKKTDSDEIKALKALVEGESKVDDKTVSAEATLEAKTDVST
jgi:hypothetical protein